MSLEPFKVASVCRARATEDKEAFRINNRDYSPGDVTLSIYQYCFKSFYLSISIISNFHLFQKQLIHSTTFWI